MAQGSGVEDRLDLAATAVVSARGHVNAAQKTV